MVAMNQQITLDTELIDEFSPSRVPHDPEFYVWA
jgi:hypothetical protein